MWTVGFTTRSKGWGARSLFQEKKNSFVSRNCNLLQHDDKPLNGYLAAFCCPPLLIKWYGFYPKTEKRKRVGGSKNCQKCVNAPGKQKGRPKKKTSILGIFNILQYYSQCPQLSWCCLWCLPSLPNAHFVDIAVLHSL